MQGELRLNIQAVLQQLAGFSGQAGTANRVDLVKNNIYTTTLNDLTRQRMGPHWRAVNYLWNQYEKVIREARTGSMHAATQLLTEAETYRSQLAPAPWLSQLLDISALPAVAYLRYKQDRLAEAERLLRFSIESDAGLLAEGYYILAFHRVQQLHNLARLYFKKQQLAAGAAFIREGLAFMLLGRTPSTGSGWQHQDVEAVPVRLRSDMSLQLAGEVLALMPHYPREERLLFYETFGDLTDWQPQTESERALLDWITAKAHFLGGRFERFLPAAAEFLTGQPAGFDPHKLSLLTNLTDLLVRTGGYTPAAQQRVRGFADQLNVPPKGRDQLLAVPATVPVRGVPALREA